MTLCFMSNNLKGFGLAVVRGEGLAIHPDNADPDMSDERYTEQLKKYIKDTGHADCFCCRPHLLKKALNNG